MSDPDFSATIERFTGFGSAYNQVRPAAPEALAHLLLPIARCTDGKANLVVDLGCGTGLSTRYWAAHARNVIGVEPTDSMREEAVRIGGENISYIKGFSHSTGLPYGCADLVVCAQSLHWMEPFGTFAEGARILRKGGVFAAYDYDWPPSTSFWEVDLAYTECMVVARRLERDRGITEKLHRWEKEGHLARMQQSGCFRFVRESLLHHQDQGGAERVVGLLLSQGHVQSLLKLGVSEEELQIGRLRDAAKAAFGESDSRWFWSARVRIGIK
ncbi:class I SAM-dependent methyltransferase [Verrucomicrobiota bacterium sgz303538]